MNPKKPQPPAKPDARFESIAETEERSLAAVIRRVARRPRSRHAERAGQREPAEQADEASE